MTAPGVGMPMADSWGTKSSTIEVGSNSFRIDGFEFDTTAMAVWRKVRSEFEVFTDTDYYLRPSAGSEADFIRVSFGVAVGAGEYRSFGESGNDLFINGENAPEQGEPPNIAWMIDWTQEGEGQGWSAGQVQSVEVNLEMITEFPSPCIVSFGNLIDY